MTISRIRKAALLSCVAITLQFGSACSPAEVLEGARQLGVELTSDQAEALSGHLTVVDTPAEVEALIRATWPDHAEDRAVAIATCESGLAPNAKNRTSSASGVFQLMAAHWRGRFDPFNARANIAYAYRLWQSSGWSPWVCRG